MEHLSKVAPKANCSRANNIASSQHVAPPSRLPTSLLSTRNGSNALMPIENSAPPQGARSSGQAGVESTEQICEKLIANAQRLLKNPTAGTAKRLGFKSVDDAKKQLVEKLKTFIQATVDEIATVKVGNTPLTSKNIVVQRQQSLHAHQAQVLLEALSSTSGKRA